ncbi:M23 family metallopeptidase [Roseibium salinum]|uniref:M23 family metallopeptidase n=1 Tax=Roseibium salinum TaxID=1604349 RepID=A0ABT3R0M7_9HYPH|nr:M23 family metallopeptidase [Roseibium sp. DSM 29163]MCX2722790.1 M23 family metallopeptidase [Roseibium sp. DSM 29163]
MSQAQDVASAKSWKGWTSAGGTRVQVRQGDDLNSIARRYGVPVQALTTVNGIDDPKAVRPGQSIIVPTYSYADNSGATRNAAGNSQPIVTASVGRPGRKPGEQPSFNDVDRGAVAESDANLVQVSALPKRKPGDVDGTFTTASVSRTDPAPTRQPANQSTGNTQSGTVDKDSLPAPALTQEAAPSEPIKTPVVASIKEDTDVSTGQFRWPVQGRIISEFGAKPGGGKNEGVNLAVPEGTPVKAADDGTVIYSGNELKGYGNLILLRHSQGWVSAYAHNSELKVKRGDTVRRGDVVGLAGATGSVNQPQLHFELRQGNKPVDPLKYMPRR